MGIYADVVGTRFGTRAKLKRRPDKVCGKKSCEEVIPSDCSDRWRARLATFRRRLAEIGQLEVRGMDGWL